MLKEAIELARSNPTDLPQMAAIIVKRKNVLGIGLNSRKTHPLQARFGADHHKTRVHAEISALINALRVHSHEDIRGSSIYVARVTKDGNHALAKPCEGCRKALEAYGIKGVSYTE